MISNYALPTYTSHSSPIFTQSYSAPSLASYSSSDYASKQFSSSFSSESGYSSGGSYAAIAAAPIVPKIAPVPIAIKSAPLLSTYSDLSSHSLGNSQLGYSSSASSDYSNFGASSANKYGASLALSSPLITKNVIAAPTFSSNHHAGHSGNIFINSAPITKYTVSSPSYVSNDLSHGSIYNSVSLQNAAPLKIAAAPAITSNYLATNLDHSSYASGNYHSSYAKPIVVAAPAVKLTTTPFLTNNYLSTGLQHNSAGSSNLYGGSHLELASGIKIGTPILSNSYLSSGGSHSSANSHFSGGSNAFGSSGINIATSPVAVVPNLPHISSHSIPVVTAKPLLAAPTIISHSAPQTATHSISVGPSVKYAAPVISTGSAAGPASSIGSSYISSGGPVVQAPATAIVKPIAVKQDGYYVSNSSKLRKNL